MITTRRTVLKSIAAALMTPTIRLRPEIPDERLLLPFCDPDAFRWESMKKPFGVGSLTYATDSKAMVRCELAGRQQDGEIKLPPVEKVWPQYWEPSDWIPLTPGNARPNNTYRRGPCPECGDRRVSYGPEYPTADEFADPHWLQRIDYDVDDNTIRDTSCRLCRGVDYCGPSCTEICGVFHATWNLRRVLALPNVMVSGSRSMNGALLFRADGFEGVSLGFALA